MNGQDRHGGVETLVIECRLSALASITSAAAGFRFRIISREGSTAISDRSAGS